jgi:hypothetical protein
LGGAAATSEFLARLAELLRGQDNDVRRVAVNAVGGLGGAAAIPEILTGLADLLHEILTGLADLLHADLLQAAPEGPRLDWWTMARLGRRLGLRFVRQRDKIIPRRVADLACGCEFQEACP